MQRLYTALILYAWGLQAFVDRSDVDGRGSDLLYALTVAPAVLFILVGFTAYLRTNYSRAVLALLAMAFAVSVVALARLDYSTVASVTALCLMLGVILHSRVTAGVAMVNFLFFASLVGTAIFQLMGQGKYGIIPGTSAFDQVGWRVSLFPYNITPSWMLCMVVIGLNATRNRRRWCAWAMIALALYFLVFSASRTGLIVLSLWLLFATLTKVWEFRRRFFYKALIPTIAVIFVILLNAEQILTLLVAVDNPIANLVLFKSAEGAQDASASIVRTFIWAHHLDLLAANPIIGNGTFTLADEVDLQAFNTSGAESFLTGLLARVGLLALPFLYFMYRLGVDAATRRDRLAYCMAIFFVVTSLAYGSYIVPYDFVFLLVFGAMNHNRVASASE